jgi:hypothetical protein
LGWGIKNLNIPNAQITVGDTFQKVGILCGLNQSLIHNCQVSGTIVCGNGSTKIGGICGSNGDGSGIAGIITHCHADISISSSSATGSLGECGGICGYNGGNIAHCSSEGGIIAWSLNIVGGICGLQEGGHIVSSSLEINISAENYLSVAGGLCGLNLSNGSIRHSSARGHVASSKTIWSVGGFCGRNTSGCVIDACFSTGSIMCGPSGHTTMPGDEQSGGFCGANVSGGQILNCFSTGDIYCGPINPELFSPTQ